ncbi:DUF4240 domain-containing protein [Kitasatospora sp. DSM 101779]|uniref:DUF4240 domain-containing protein n=1 Tax=Kitasatospora sp. DSM 101779 TaxID=2853165 RepID=UPI0021D8A801|nr:DUF4240 domain-containing protein [Kitasatospora sp. DSM 101779]MCU7822026.1 DUF4240 domain-containing protein [Kitasatospora sp. DSM 101779]
MDKQQFWDLIEAARRPDPDDAEAVVGRATALLAARARQEILAAQQLLWDLMAESYRGDLWGAAYLINGGCSDDGFDYFRGWLIVQGREVFERAVAGPDSLAELPSVREAAAKHEDLECEHTLGLAWDAHLAATGEQMSGDCYTIAYPEIAFGWDFDDEEETVRRLPRLAALYGE